MNIWEWMATLAPAQATIVGTAVGATIGFFTLIGGALINAQLNRRRDQAKLNDDALAIAAALKADLTGVANTIRENASQLKNSDSSMLIRNPSHSLRVLPHALDKIGLLDIEAITAVIGAYTLIDQYIETVLILGGIVKSGVQSNRFLVELPGSRNKDLAAITETTVEGIKMAIDSLEATLA